MLVNLSEAMPHAWVRLWFLLGLIVVATDFLERQPARSHAGRLFGVTISPPCIRVTRRHHHLSTSAFIDTSTTEVMAKIRPI